MGYTEKQAVLMAALEQFNEALDAKWEAVVDATNSLEAGIRAKTDHYDASFPPEIERAFDYGADCTAWIYNRLERAAGITRDTSRKIRRAMGYMG